MSSYLNNNRKVLILNSKTMPTGFDLSTYELIVGIEHGAYFLYKHKYENTIFVSDFDSITKEELDELKSNVVFDKMILLNTDKDQSDTEYAINFVKKRKYQYTDIDVYVSSPEQSFRIEHDLNHILLVQKYSGINFFNQNSYMSVLRYETETFQGFDKNFKYFSAFCFGSALISIRGAKYNVKDAKINSKSASFFLSNEVTKEDLTIDTSGRPVIIIFTKH